MPRKIDLAVLILTETALPYALILFAGALDLLTTYIGLSRGLIETDGVYFQFLANLIYCGVLYLQTFFPQKSFVRETHFVCAGIFIVMSFYPVANNLFFILFS